MLREVLTGYEVCGLHVDFDMCVNFLWALGCIIWATFAAVMQNRLVADDDGVYADVERKTPVRGG